MDLQEPAERSSAVPVEDNEFDISSEEEEKEMVEKGAEEPRENTEDVVARLRVETAEPPLAEAREPPPLPVSPIAARRRAPSESEADKVDIPDDARDALLRLLMEDALG